MKTIVRLLTVCGLLLVMTDSAAVYTVDGERKKFEISRTATPPVIDGVHFKSVILRGFKLDLEDAREDYGQVAVYRGTIPKKPKSFTLGLDDVFLSGQARRVDRNTADMLRKTRYEPHFAVSPEVFHVGPFDGSDRGAESGCC